MEEFVFTWKIEYFNLSVVKKAGLISSPEFVVDSLEKTGWFLQIYPYGNTDEAYVACYLCRAASDDGPKQISVDFTLSLVMNDGSEHLCNKMESESFEISGRVGCNNFKRRDDLTKEKKKFLPNGTLTVRCYIQLAKAAPLALEKKETAKIVASYMFGENSEIELSREMYDVANFFLKLAKNIAHPSPHACMARTKVGIEKRSCTWSIKNFTELDKKGFLSLASISKLTPPLLLSWHLDNKPGTDKHIIIEMKKKKDFATGVIVFCEITLLDKQEKPTDIKCSKYFFDSLKKDQVWNFPLLTVKFREIIDNSEIYLRNNTLSLHLSFIFSRGDVLSQIEETFVPSKETFESKRDSENANCLINDIRLLSSDSKLCDVTLVLGDEKFPTHKAILSARSPVFKAMFELEMAEKASGIVELTDMDSETLTKMLTFMYGGTLDDLQCEVAAKLYTASDKYECIPLKELCHYHLRSNLTIANVSDVLLLADIHQDKDMKSAAENFIVSHGSEVLSSDEWKVFMKNHVKLAVETLNRIGLLLMNA